MSKLQTRMSSLTASTTAQHQPRVRGMVGWGSGTGGDKVGGRRMEAMGRRGEMETTIDVLVSPPMCVTKGLDNSLNILLQGPNH